MNIGYNRAADPSRYGAVILAGGLSSRMKAFKPLLPVDGQPAIAGLAETLRSAGISDIVVVTGYRREELQEEIQRLRLIEAYNENYEQGMFSSIRTGLAKAGESFPEKRGFFLVPVDCPLITIRALREVMTAADGEESTLESEPANESEGAPGAHANSAPADTSATGAPGAPEASADERSTGRFYVPTFEGKKGHPLLIPAGRVQEILDYTGDGGLKAVTDQHWEEMVRVPVPDEEILLDMDTPEGYEAIQDFVAHGFRREKLEVLSARKRIILVRHGQTRQHEEPMFIGQYDVPLSEEGREQARQLGAQIADIIGPDVEASANWIEGISLGREPLSPIEHIWCSDLQRSEETARIIAGQLISRYGTKADPRGSTAEAGASDGALKPQAFDAPGPQNIMNMMGRLPGTSGNAGMQLDVQPLEGLREIDLGAWDGRPVREVREQDPEGYARRGKDLFTFKTGNRSENFYDMQYRAVAALREILTEDYARNVIIVAHSGVLRAIENNLKGLRVDDDWKAMDKGTLRIWESAGKGV